MEIKSDKPLKFGVSENNEAPARKLLEDYQSKMLLDTLLAFALALCIPYGSMLILVFVFSVVVWLNPNAKITIVGPPWYFFLSLLSVPVFFLRKRVKKSLETAKKNLLFVISKGLIQSK